MQSLPSVIHEPPEHDIKIKETEMGLNNEQLCCYRCKFSTCMGFIAAYMKIRAVGLILTSFIPPLLKVEYEKSWRYPEGNSELKTYFENSTLDTLYVINIILCFFLLCYGIATYYTWSIA